MESFVERIEENPVIAAIRNEDDLSFALSSPVSTIFLLHADIFNIGDMVQKIEANGQNVFVHMDFLEGIGKDKKAVEYIVKNIKPDGIISTRTNHIKYAKEMGIFTIQRFFMVDSLSYDTTIRTVKTIKPHMIEVMPAVIPRVIQRISTQLDIPIIGGGLIANKEDIIEVLKHGAVGASTGKRELWSL